MKDAQRGEFDVDPRVFGAGYAHDNYRMITVMKWRVYLINDEIMRCIFDKSSIKIRTCFIATPNDRKKEHALFIFIPSPT